MAEVDFERDSSQPQRPDETQDQELDYLSFSFTLEDELDGNDTTKELSEVEENRDFM